MKITGTFIDEITYDIPSQNWTAKDWDKEFATMKAVGIDTVIIIRCGLRDQVIYPSKVLPKWRPMLPVYEDLGMVFLDLAEKHGIRLLWGTYDTSPEWWQSSEKCREIVEIHKDLMPEIWERYGKHKAFGGWYLTYEFGVKNDDHLNIVYNLGKTAKQLSPNLPVMISPYVQGPKATDRAAITIEEHERQWNEILEFISPYVNIVAFQDGLVHITDLPDYIKVNVELMKKYGLESWSNIESFENSYPLKFPPMDWRRMRAKMEAATQGGAQKLITFEFSHFMSPNSCYPAAHNLFRRYCDHFDIKLD